MQEEIHTGSCREILGVVGSGQERSGHSEALGAATQEASIVEQCFMIVAT